MSNLRLKLPTLPQSGFAVIPLVVLLLVGITAGVYLTQTGVNFLPQAAVPGAFSCDLSQINTPGKSECAAEGQVVVFSHCDISAAGGQPFKRDTLSECRSAASDGQAAVNLYCTWSKECTGTSTATAGGCTQAEINACKSKNSKTDRCYKSSNGGAVCLYSASLERKAECDTTCPNGNNQGCLIIRGEQRCVYPDSAAVTKCDPKDGGSSCKLIKRDGTRISTDAQKCNNGWRNFCRLLFNKGCKDMPDEVPDCDGPVTPLSQPAAPAAGTGTTAQTSTNTRNPQQTGAATTAPDLTKDSFLKLITNEMRQAAQEGAESATGPLDKATAAFTRSREKANATVDQASVLFADTFMIASIRVIKKDWDPGTGNIIAKAKSDGVTDAQIKAIVTAGVDALNKLRKDAPKITANSIHSFRSSTTTSASSGQINQAGAINCDFTDETGTQIPCFKVGVFTSLDDLKATEAQASIASQRYVKSQEILAAAKDKINTDIANLAQAKLETAKTKAAACMKK